MERFANHSRVIRSGTTLVFCLLFARSGNAADLSAHKNLRLWLKADAITGVADGGSIERWEDASRAQAHATQSLPSQQPKLRAAKLNGKPVVEFDGSRTQFRLPDDSVIPSVRDMDVFAVFSKASNSGYDTLFGGGSGGDSPLLGTNNDQLTFYNSGASPVELKSSRQVPLQTFVVVEYFKEVADVMVHMDGSLAGQMRMMPSSGNIGDARHLGGDGGGEMFDGSVAELVFFDTALTDDERREVRCYLAAKYALRAAAAECGR